MAGLPRREATKFAVRAFWLPKEGNLPDEYEDAFAFNLEKRRFAIADGATEASFSGRWARILVQGFLDKPLLPSTCLEDWLKPFQEEWASKIDWKQLKWFAEEKARQGAFSTLLGFELQNMVDDVGCWSACAIGDSCLFQVRNDSLIASFPSTSSNEFGRSPALLRSILDKHSEKQPINFLSGQWLSGDFFLLATDALAQWFLTERENNRKPWRRLTALKSQKTFQEFVIRARLRSRRRLKNDDMTLLMVFPPRILVKRHKHGLAC